ncbi:hypothetical protein TSUD_383940 [Trifolium subterraneum]|uniref:Peptidase S8/S53 domain-containing protein n=1 Tax=Trifolium subterraneum TaxID=3900 RepID=A0A2Z6MTV1_TRISU|nr:hypothetical protein TSUD_383940 [Trifolium subterraneum]
MEKIKGKLKIIGARYYLQGYESLYGPLNEQEDYKSARDKDGHGTHTASIVAGRAVQNASALGGFASGTAIGGAPLARLAIYKACWPIKGKPKSDGNVCTNIDMLKAIDDAIEDGSSLAQRKRVDQLLHSTWKTVYAP